MKLTGRELRSALSAEGKLRLSLEDVVLDDPAPDEVIVRVEAAPIHPSDMLLLIGPADPSTLKAGGTSDRPTLTLDVPKARLARGGGWIGRSFTVGNEGAGAVVAAGSAVKALEGKRVATFAGGLFADYVKARAANVVPLPDGVTPADAAAIFVNPLTALGIVETAKTEGHRAMVHTAAASNVGRMVQRICSKDGYPLVNIVRSTEQMEVLRQLGATHVLNSKDETFGEKLFEAVSETGATVAFDPIGGGTLGSTIMEAMERAAAAKMTEYVRYGSSTFKQLYLYGGLDVSPTSLNRIAFGTRWSVSSWFLGMFLEKIGPQGVAKVTRSVLDELTTTFATHYTRTIGLAEALTPEALRAYSKISTGEKYLIDPTRG